MYKNRDGNKSWAHERQGLARKMSFIPDLLLEFIPVILKPYFYLCRREVYESR